MTERIRERERERERERDRERERERKRERERWGRGGQGRGNTDQKLPSQVITYCYGYRLRNVHVQCQRSVWSLPVSCTAQMAGYHFAVILHLLWSSCGHRKMHSFCRSSSYAQATADHQGDLAGLLRLVGVACNNLGTV